MNGGGGGGGPAIQAWGPDGVVEADHGVVLADAGDDLGGGGGGSATIQGWSGMVEDAHGVVTDGWEDFGVGGGGGTAPAIPAVPKGVSEAADSEVLEDRGWTDLATIDLLEIALRLLGFARPFGAEKLNRLGFWRDVSQSLELDKKLERSPRSCEARYKAVMSYYRRKRATVKGQDYRFAKILEDIIPMDDLLQLTRTTAVKKGPVKRSAVQQAQAAAGASGAADAAGEVPQLLRQLISDLHDRDTREAAWRAEVQACRAEVQQLRAQQESWQAEITSMLQTMTSMLQACVQNIQHHNNLDPLFPNNDVSVSPLFPNNYDYDLPFPPDV